MGETIYANKDLLIDDINCLKQILDGQLNIQDIDYNTKERLVYICNKRNTEIKDKIEVIRKEIQKLKNQ